MPVCNDCGMDTEYCVCDINEEDEYPPYLGDCDMSEEGEDG